MANIGELKDAVKGDWRSRTSPILDELRNADAVVASDSKLLHSRIIFGRAVIEALARGDVEVVSRSPKPTVMNVALDLSGRTDDLEVLCAICDVIKGSYERA